MQEFAPIEFETFLEYLFWNLDVYLTVFATVVAFGFLAYFTWRDASNRKLLGYVCASAVIILFAAIFLVNAREDANCKFWIDFFYQKTYAISEAISHLEHKNLEPQKSAIETNVYGHIFALTEDLRKKNPYIAFIGTFRKISDNKYVYMVAPAADYNSDEIDDEGEDGPQMPGTDYLWRDEIDSDLADAISGNEDRIVLRPFTHQGHTFITGVSVIQKQDGIKPDEALEIDFRAETFLGQIAAARRVPLYFALFALSTIFLGTAAHIKTKENVKNLKEAKNKAEYNELLFRKVFDSGADSMGLALGDTVVLANRQMLERFNLTPETVHKFRVHDFSPEFQPNGKLSRDIIAERREKALAGSAQFIEWTYLIQGCLIEVEVLLDRLEIQGYVYLFFSSKQKPQKESSPVKSADANDISKLKQQKSEPTLTDFSIQGTAETVIGLLAGLAKKKKLEMCATFTQDVPRIVHGNEKVFRHTLFNLVDFAIKSTGKGGVHVNVSVDNWDQEKSEKSLEFRSRCFIKVEVRDSRGDQRDDFWLNMLQFSTQTNSFPASSDSVSGVSLRIAKQFISQMGGEMGIEVKKEKGTVIWFTVPFYFSKVSSLIMSSSQISPIHGAVNLTGRPVLIVDETQIQRNAILTQFEAWGMSPVVCSSQQEASEAMEAAQRRGSQIQVVIIDETIAQGSGIEYIQDILKSNLHAQAGLILLMSPDEISSLPPEFHDSGVQLLHKPLYCSALLDATLNAIFQHDESVSKATPKPDGRKSSDSAVFYSPLPQNERPKILVAEDNSINQFVMEDLLKRANIDCQIVGDGLEALSAFFSGRFHLVLMDCHMPNMDGFAAATEIRKIEAAEGRKRVPIVALTASVSKTDEKRCLDAGMDSHCSKPLHPKAFYEMISHWLKKSAE